MSLSVGSLNEYDASVKKVNFGSNNKNDNIERNSCDDKMKTSTKFMLGAIGLSALALAGIAIAKKGKLPKSEKLNEAVTQIKKSVHDMDELELMKWSKKKILKAQRLFSKKRDLTNWEKPYNKNNPFGSYRYKAHNMLGPSSESGFLFIERVNKKDGTEIIKAFTNDGNLDSILVINNSKVYEHIRRNPAGGFFVKYADKSPKGANATHNSPFVQLKATVSDDGIKYTTELFHDVHSEVLGGICTKPYRSIEGLLIN